MISFSNSKERGAVNEFLLTDENQKLYLDKQNIGFHQHQQLHSLIFSDQKSFLYFEYSLLLNNYNDEKQKKKHDIKMISDHDNW